MKAYIRTTNMMNKDCFDVKFTHEVGKTSEIYEITNVEGKNYDFRFYEKMNDALESISKNLVLLEVEILGDVINRCGKSFTNKLKIIRIVPEEEYECDKKNDDIECKEECKYDENNNIIYVKRYSKMRNGEYEIAHELWFEYDENNNNIYLKMKKGRGRQGIGSGRVTEFWKKYDANNNQIHVRNNNGYELWREYDDSNNLIYYKDSEGFEKWFKYNENNKIIYFKNSNGYERWVEFNGNNSIHYKNSEGSEYNISSY